MVSGKTIAIVILIVFVLIMIGVGLYYAFGPVDKTLKPTNALKTGGNTSGGGAGAGGGDGGGAGAGGGGTDTDNGGTGGNGGTVAANECKADFKDDGAFKKDKCVFPFTYEGRTFTGCTTWDPTAPNGHHWEGDNAAWCSYDRYYIEGRWGNCNNDCPRDENGS